MKLGNRKSTNRCLIAMLSALLAIAGCDGRPKRAPVSGTVLIDGVPLNYGTVEFVPDGGRASSGVLDSNGHFTLACFTDKDGALIGKHRIRIHANEEINPTTIRIHAPTRYEDLQSSELSQEIKGDNDSIAINLTWKGSGHDKPYTVTSGSPGDEEPPRPNRPAGPK